MTYHCLNCDSVVDISIREGTCPEYIFCPICSSQNTEEIMMLSSLYPKTNEKPKEYHKLHS
ncbi:hypothetical protein M0R19_03315 [Candidatus Pacearchaeota archaeon]|jgi:hypothetical protein|nr:hypothetical protein [Candidatus Pacearchaeota archaeon]